MTLNEYKNINKDFSESMFITKVNNIFVKLLSSIMFDRLEEVDHFISDEVYESTKKIIEENNQLGIRKIYDELNIKDCRISSIRIDKNIHHIHVCLEARYMEYFTRIDNGEYISGNNQSRTTTTYILRFIKDANTKEQEEARACPTCGANLSVNTSGKCKYCGTIYNQEDYDWILESYDKY